MKKNNIVYKNYYNIGVAVGTPEGLVVPVLKNAENMDFPEIEKTIFFKNECIWICLNFSRSLSFNYI